MSRRAALPPWWYRALTGALEPWAARWGQAGEPAALRARRGRGVPTAETWIHAASVGEASGVPPLVAEWRARRPQESLLASALTPSGRRALVAGLPGVPVTAPPVESLAAARRALAESRARRLVLLETELWPAWLAAAHERGVRVAVANGRLSDRAWRRYARWAVLFRPHLRGLAAVGAQSALDAERFRALGVPAERLQVTGSTKFDRLAEEAGPPGDGERRRARAELGLDPEGLWCVFGSLRPGEERWLERALARTRGTGLRALVVPRHPDRWRGLGRPGEGEGAVWLLRLGVLPQAYRAADVAVIGGTLERYGGHNPVEPAALGVPVVLGPSLENCRAAAAALLASGGARLVEDPEALGEALFDWCASPAARRAAGAAARQAALSLAGAARRTLDWFERCGLWA